VDVLFKLKSQTENEYALAPTHEEQVTPILKKFVNSYKDLPEFSEEKEQFPLAVYQIQTKFRDELRSKAGLMRGREFRMKDLYDLHQTKEFQEKYFELVTKTYHKIYNEIGLESYAVDASGGDFSDKFSREFQVICEAGEDEIMYSQKTGFACNIEVLEDAKAGWNKQERGYDFPIDLQKAVSAEVGNIFDLGQKWVKAFEVSYIDQNNQKQYPYMGCHGMGTSRCLGVIAEIYSDQKGLKWPETVAPFKYHLVTHLNNKGDSNLNQKVLSLAQKIYDGLLVLESVNGEFILRDLSKFVDPSLSIDLSQHLAKDEDILWDDRADVSLGEKLKDADLIGCPWQIILTPRNLENNQIEIKRRSDGESSFVRF
jgi:prolyl-tRNA synthetase